MALRAYRGYGRYLVELMRLPRARPTRCAALVPDLDIDEVRRIWHEAPAAAASSSPSATSAATRPWPRPSPATACRSASSPTTRPSPSCSSCCAAQRERWGVRIIPWRNLREIYGVLRRREMLGLLVDWGYRARRHPGPAVRRVDDAAGRAGDAGRQDRLAHPAGHHPAPAGRHVPRRVAGPDRGRIVRAGRAPARDPGDRRRARGDDRRGARAVVQLQADLAGRPPRRRPTSSGGRGLMQAGVARSRGPRPSRLTVAGLGRAAARSRPDRRPRGSPAACPSGRSSRARRARRRPVVPGDAGARRAGPPEPAPGRRLARGARTAGRRWPAPRRDDPRALERLVRLAFRHAARYYLEVARTPALTRRRPATSGSTIETPDAVAEAFAGDPVIFVGLHFGAIELPALFLAAPGRRRRRPDGDASTTRSCRPGSCGRAARSACASSGCARRAASCSARCATGRSVGLVGDRDLTGGGTPTDALRGAGDAAARAGAARRRERRAGLRRRRPSRRRRVATAAALERGRRPGRGDAARARHRDDRPIARAFERVIADAPEQWWAVFFPIWPDLPSAGRAHRPRRRRVTTDRLGRADLHIHTLASDGTADVVEILDHVGRARRPRRHRHHRPRADRRRASPRGRWPATAACAFEVVVGEEVTTLGGHLLALFIERPDPAVPLAAVDDRRRPRGRRPGHPGPPARALPAVRPGLGAAPAARRPRRGGPPGRHRDVQPDGARAGRGTIVSCGSPTSTGSPASATATPTRSTAIGAGWTTFPGRTADDLRAAIAPGATEHGGSFHGATGQVGVFGRQLRKRAVDARDEVAGRVRRTAPAATTATPAAVPDRRATSRDPARRGSATRREDRPRLPVHLPGRGGVAQHVRYLYENLRLRGHDVRILTASHGPQRSSEGDIIRLGVGLLGADQRVGRDAHLLAALPAPDRRHARARAVRRPPLPRAVRAVPVAVPAARVDERQRRDVPRLRRLLALVRVRQPRAARPRAQAPRPDRGERRGPPLHRPLLPGRLQGHPQRRRRAPLRQRRADRALAGRHAEHPVRRPPRAAQGRCWTCSRPTASCARPAPTPGCSSSAPGRRSARRGATSRRAASRASSSSAA